MSTLFKHQRALANETHSISALICSYPCGGGFPAVHFWMKPGAGNSLLAWGRASEATRQKIRKILLANDMSVTKVVFLLLFVWFVF